MKRSDFRIDDHGSIVLLYPMTDSARTWTGEHLPEDAPTFGKAYAIERRYVAPILQGLLEDGLTLGNANTIGGQS